MANVLRFAIVMETFDGKLYNRFCKNFYHGDISFTVKGNIEEESFKLEDIKRMTIVPVMIEESKV